MLTSLLSLAVLPLSAYALTAGSPSRPCKAPLAAGWDSRPSQTPSAPAPAPRPARSLTHVDVYRVAGRYGGWPANHGIWAWGNEILVGFEAGYFKDSKSGHSIDYTRAGRCRECRMPE